jgi:uncharacterized Zn finger protein
MSELTSRYFLAKTAYNKKEGILNMTLSLVLRARNENSLPDNSQWTNRFQVKSESSNRLYVIAQHKVKRFWGCSCPGWKIHRKCKHLAALMLPAYEKPFELAE